MESVLVGGGRAKLNANVLMDLNFIIPKKAEQIVISSLFQNLETLITLHQRKYFIKFDEKILIRFFLGTA